MGRIEKTVFISYRRTNMPWALAIYQNLSSQGYDVFFDYLSIKSGDFEQIIIGNIKARAHFVVVLTPSALERCNEPGDWLRREIETGIDEKRNIVPLMLESFDFGSPSTLKALTGKLENLRKYNGLRVPSDYFFEAMARLREQFLNTPLDAVLHPLPVLIERATNNQKLSASRATPVTQNNLSAQEWFEEGWKRGDAGEIDESIQFSTEAIRLRPDFAEAYYNRGLSYQNKGDIDSAVRDYAQAILLYPDYQSAHGNLGILLEAKNDFDGAIREYNEAIRLKPNDAQAFYNRGNARYRKGHINEALDDYNKAIYLKPDYYQAYNNKGNILYEKEDYSTAFNAYTESIRLNPNYSDPYKNRANIWLQRMNYPEALSDLEKCFKLGDSEQWIADTISNIKRLLEK